MNYAREKVERVVLARDEQIATALGRRDFVPLIWTAAPECRRKRTVSISRVGIDQFFAVESHDVGIIASHGERAAND